MNLPKTAIVILNWNGEKLLPRFLPSVIRHTTYANVEIVVADNASTDQSVSFVKEHYPQIRLVQLTTNYGFAQGYNEALKQIPSDYYVLLNSDVEVTEGWLPPLLSLMLDQPAIAAVQPKIRSYHRKDEFEYAGAAGGYIDKLGFPFCRGRILNVNEKDEGQYDQPTSIFWASGACMAINARLFHRAGGFDASFWAHMEEIDLCWRLKNMGYQIFFTPGSKVYHLGGGTLSYDNPHKLYLNFRNSLWLLFKNLPRNKFYRVIFFRLALDGIAAFKLLSEFNINGFFSVFHAHMSFYRSWRRIRATRDKLKRTAPPQWHPEILCKSIIWKFYIEGIKRFGDIR